MKEAFKYLQAGAIVPVDMETTILLVNALKEALAQPAQEPVAFFNGRGWQSGKLEVIPAKRYQTFEIDQPLYAAPPQRPWVGLTDEDCKGMNAGDRVVAMWADRTLKEKNNG